MADSLKTAAAPPYVKFYFRDWSDGVTALPAILRGCHISLLAYQWNHKHVPGDDPEQLRMIMGVASKAEAKKCWEGIKHKYPQQADGRYLNPRLEAERAKVQKFFDAQAAKAENGGRPKKGKPAEKPRELPRVIPGVSHGRPITDPEPDPEPTAGTKTHQGSEISSPSAELSQPERTETSSPSDAHASTVGNGWQVWVQIKELARETAPRSLQWFEHVYAAHLVNGRLELYVEQLDMANWLMKHYTGTIGEGLAAAGQGTLTVRAIAKPRPVAKARAS